MINSVRLTPDDLRRFDAFVYPDPNSGCFLWSGSEFGRNRYGCFTVQGTTYAAHRVAWLAANGPIPTGKQVLHKCDTPCCVNPDHLFLGAHAENMIDMAKKGRGTTSKRGLPLGVLAVRGRFRAVVKRDRKGIHLGYYDTAREAAAAVDSARRAMGLPVAQREGRP